MLEPPPPRRSMPGSRFIFESNMEINLNALFEEEYVEESRGRIIVGIHSFFGSNLWLFEPGVPSSRKRRCTRMLLLDHPSITVHHSKR